jgi:sterol 3beta-glucosyltransferase
MKFLAVTYGTEGDTRPMAALCHALRAAGHDVQLLADRSTLHSAHKLGVPAAALSGDIQAALQSETGLAKLVRGGSRFNDTAKALAQLATENSEAWMRTTLEAGAGCDAILFGGLTAFVGLSAAERLGARAIGTGLIPITPTRDFASPFLPPHLLPRWLNRFSHHFVNQAIWRAFRATTNAARTRVAQLPPRRTLWADHPMLYGVSPNLLPRPADWPANALVCGQWQITAASDWTPPPSLAAFLAAGDKPIYVGFGSMAGFDHARFLHEIVTAIGGRRALFYPGWSGVDATSLPANFHILDDTPHDWLFPRTSLVIHHGGAGTSHSAARAGVPSIVVPFAGDQFFWADRLQRAGVAPAALRVQKLTAAALGKAIAAAETMRVRADALGAAMAKEDGLAVALAAIERLMR